MPAPSPYRFEQFLNVRAASAPSFTADGLALVCLSDITGVNEVWRVGLPESAGSDARWPYQLTFRGERALTVACAPVAAPDGRQRIAVCGDIGGDERGQIWLIDAAGHDHTPLTNRLDVIHQFGAWSPDGQRIAYASNERDPRFFDIYERDLQADAPRLVWQDDGSNHAAGYDPTGRYLLVEHSTDSHLRNQLVLVELATSAARELTPLAATGLARHHQAVWAEGGQALYCLSDRGREFMAPARIDLATGAMTFLRDEPWDAELLALSRDGARLALACNVDGYSRLEAFDLTDGWERRRALSFAAADLPAGVIADLAWSPDGRTLAATLAAADGTTDLWALRWLGDAPEPRRVTRSATGGVRASDFVAPTLIRYPTFDERAIPAWLYTPPATARDLPVVIYVHGGPESQIRPTFNPVIEYLVSQGYGVLAPNVRGSTGYGATYTSLDDVRRRMDSVNDLRHAALWLATQGIADPRRIAVMGGSYGGFMVLSALTTYPDLWAAGVDIVGIANFVTFLEQTGPWRRVLREAEYGSLANDRDFLVAISPVHQADRITAPLFVVHGTNDPRVPVGETRQIIAALQARGVPVESLIFPDEGHGVVKRANRLVAYPAIARFLDAHLRG